jgi:beta-lactamase regulating signal transducer with metallopeptidase domain
MSAFAEAVRPGTDACWTYLFHVSWQAAVVGLLMLTLVAIGRRMSAPVRYGLLMVALVKFVLPHFAAMPCGVLSRFTPPLGATEIVERPTRPASVSNLPIDSALDHKTLGMAPAQFPKNSAATRSPISIPASPVVTASPSKSGAPPTRVAEAPISSVRVPIAPTESHARESVIEGAALPQLPEATARGLDFQQIALFAWVAGLCLVVAWLFQQGWRLRQILRGSTPVESAELQARMRVWARRLGLKRVPELRQAKSGAVPFSCGLLAPKVVVPRALFEQLSPGQIDVILSHELAHHWRRDLWANALQLAVFVVFWFHPVVWILNRALRRIREDCCDDVLLSNGLITPEACCETLLAVARAQAGAGSLVWGVSTGHPLGARLSRLMDDSQVRRLRLSRRGWLCLIAASALLWPGLRLAAAGQNGSEAVRQTAGAPQATPKPADANGGAANPRSCSATKAAAPATVEYTTLVTGLKGRRFDKVAHAKLVVANGRRFDRYQANVPFGSAQADDPHKSNLVAWQIDRFESTSFPLTWDMVAPRRFIVVTSAGYGSAYCDLPEGTRLEKPRTFYFPKDDVPLRGQIVSVQGKPLAGVTVSPRVLQYFETAEGKPVSLDAAAPLLNAEARSRHVTRSDLEIGSLRRSTKTDSAGHFEIRGIGRERVVRLLISGPGIASRWISVATRSTPIEFPIAGQKQRLFANYWSDATGNSSSASLGFGLVWVGEPAWCDEVLPASFKLTVEPSRVIEGTVIDDRSRQPLANVRVSSETRVPGRLMNMPGKLPQPRGEISVAATTNARGEFRLVGVPQRLNMLLAEPPESLPYFNRSVECNTLDKGNEPVKLEIRLARGILVTGRLLGQKGRPFTGRISYFPLMNNPIVGAYADSVSVGRTSRQLEPQFPETQADTRGRFSIPVLPGPGILLADFREPGTRRARLDLSIDPNLAFLYAFNMEDNPTAVMTSPRPLSLKTYGAYKGIDVPADVESAQVDLQVDAGHAVEGQVVDPRGKAVAGVLAFGTSRDQLPPDGRFDTRALAPGRPRLLYFLQPEKGLGGSCRVEDGEAGPITVGLEPTGTIRGYLADANGKPLAHARFYLAYAEADGVPRVIFPGGWRIPTADESSRVLSLGVAYPPPVDHRWETTDEDGAFLVRGVIPRLAVQIFASTSQYKTAPLAVTRVLPNRFLDLGTLKVPVAQ